MWAAIITAAVTLTAWGIKEWKSSSVGNDICGKRPMFKGKNWDDWQECTDNIQKDLQEKIITAKADIIDTKKKRKRTVIIVSVVILITGIVLFFVKKR